MARCFLFDRAKCSLTTYLPFFNMQSNLYGILQPHPLFPFPPAASSAEVVQRMVVFHFFSDRDRPSREIFTCRVISEYTKLSYSINLS